MSKALWAVFWNDWLDTVQYMRTYALPDLFRSYMSHKYVFPLIKLTTESRHSLDVCIGLL